MNTGTSWAEAGNPPFELDLYRLQFRDRRAERIFQSDTLAQSVHFIRAYLIAGTLLYVAFGILDAILGGGARILIWSIRFGVVTPILLTIFLLTFRRIFVKLMQPALAMAMLSSGLGVVAMTAIMGAPFNSLYYAGLIMVVSYCGSLIRLNFRYSAAIAVFLFGCYQVVGLWLNPIPTPLFISNDFFFG